MNGPSDELRTDVERAIDSMERELAEVDQRVPDTSAWAREVEVDVVRLLTRVLDECRRDVESDSRRGTGSTDLDPEGGEDLYAAALAWAALASYTVARIYGPRSPWHHGLATLPKDTLAVLGSMAVVLTGPLRLVRAALDAQSFSIAVQFPSAPLSVSLTFR